MLMFRLVVIIKVHKLRYNEWYEYRRENKIVLEVDTLF